MISGNSAIIASNGEVGSTARMSSAGVLVVTPLTEGSTILSVRQRGRMSIPKLKKKRTFGAGMGSLPVVIARIRHNVRLIKRSRVKDWSKG